MECHGGGGDRCANFWRNRHWQVAGQRELLYLFPRLMSEGLWRLDYCTRNLLEKIKINPELYGDGSLNLSELWLLKFPRLYCIAALFLSYFIHEKDHLSSGCHYDCCSPGPVVQRQDNPCWGEFSIRGLVLRACASSLEFLLNPSQILA